MAEHNLTVFEQRHEVMDLDALEDMFDAIRELAAEGKVLAFGWVGAGRDQVFFDTVEVQNEWARVVAATELLKARIIQEVLDE